ncbi:MAG: hypothetical protein WCD18_09750 [Thermosynechococcaceae cyanobacterium]
MEFEQNPFWQANQRMFRTIHSRWHRQRSRTQILRSQLGFTAVTSSRPLVCKGCANYHGSAYGSTTETRTRLICAIHPTGWSTSSVCPDWQGESTITDPSISL